MWKDDDELFALMRSRLFPAVVGDILDTMGFQRQFLAPQIRPLRPEMVIVGRAIAKPLGSIALDSRPVAPTTPAASTPAAPAAPARTPRRSRASSGSVSTCRRPSS